MSSQSIADIKPPRALKRRHATSTARGGRGDSKSTSSRDTCALVDEKEMHVEARSGKDEQHNDEENVDVNYDEVDFDDVNFSINNLHTHTHHQMMIAMMSVSVMRQYHMNCVHSVMGFNT